VLENSDKNVGYNAATGTYEDLLKAGIIDPVKVRPAVLCTCSCRAPHVSSIGQLMLSFFL